MKYNKKQKAMVKSFLRHLVLVWSPLVALKCTNWVLYAWALAGAVLFVAQRYVDESDKAFGRS